MFDPEFRLYDQFSDRILALDFPSEKALQSVSFDCFGWRAIAVSTDGTLIIYGSLSRLYLLM